MTPTPSTLTDRYVTSTLRSLPVHQRPDLERELRASIADAVESRIEAGTGPAEAEYAVLTELGDPARLAASYADRPLYLIGPALYLDYTRLLTALLVTVVPAVAGAVGFARIVQGASIGSILGDTTGTAATTALHLFVWTTLLFAVIERTPSLRSGPIRRWTPDSLPPAPSRTARRGALTGAIVGFVLLTTFVLVSPMVSPERDTGGRPIGFLSPWLWQAGMVYVFLGLVLAGFGITVAKLYVRWSVSLAAANALVAVASAVLLIWLSANDRLLNPAFADAAGWPADVTRWINLGLIVAAVIALVQAVIETLAGFTSRSWPSANLGRMVHTIVDGITVRAPRR